MKKIIIALILIIATTALIITAGGCDGNNELGGKDEITGDNETTTKQGIIGKWLLTDIKDTTPEGVDSKKYNDSYYNNIGYLKYEFLADGTGTIRIDRELEGEMFSLSSTITSWSDKDGLLTIITVDDQHGEESTLFWMYRISDSNLTLYLDEYVDFIYKSID